jgi:RNA polymerase primary sigma factor
MDDESVRRLQHLIEIGTKKGYVLYDEIDDLFPDDYAGEREIGDILSELERIGVEILEEPKTVLEQGIEKDELVHAQEVPDFSEYVDDPVRVYLREVGAVPRLTREDEIDLGKRIRDGGLETENARKDLCETNLRLVVSVATRYTNRGVHVLDLIQDGNDALLKAVYTFDFSHGYEFSTYATWWVRRTMKQLTSRQGQK